MFKVIFKTEGGEDVTVFAVGGENVLELARSSGVIIDAPCSGNGTCGKCRVTILEDTGENPHTRQSLACQTEITRDSTITVPVIATDYVKNITIEVFIKTGDAGKTGDGYIGKTGDGSLSYSSGRVRQRTVPCLTDITVPCLTAFGLAIDIGTTTVSALLVDLSTGDIHAKATTGNAQIRYGADVINRIIEQQKPGGIQRLQDAIVKDTLIPLINSLCKATGVPHERIKRMTIAANTTMNHLLLGVDANSIRLEPYEPAFLEFDIKSPSSIGIHLAPDAEMLIAPNVGSYVGGDITAGVLGTGAPTGWQMWPGMGEIPPGEPIVFDGEVFYNPGPPYKMSLLIDLGTNGEIVLSNREFMMTCACSAGPAFEGGDISSGMRATHGAIEAFRIDREAMEPELTVIGGGKPAGLCGSGLIDVVAELFCAGIIDGKGKFRTQLDGKTGGGSLDKTGDGSLSYSPAGVRQRTVPCLIERTAPCLTARIRHDDYGAGSYVLVFASESATGKDITLTETDIDNFIRAKGAIFSGIISLLSPLGFTPADIDDVFVAGGIGSGINIKSAISIGMLPDLPEEKYRYLGNTALDGAFSMLLPLYSEQAMEEVNIIANNMTYIDLSSQPGYMDEFIAACFLPHTNETLFPSVQSYRT